jgi:purine-nucleoside phosphorylase
MTADDPVSKAPPLVFYNDHLMSEIIPFSGLMELARKNRPVLALVLGSGLSELAQRLQPGFGVPFSDVPGLLGPSVAGHLGRLTLGTWADKRVLVFEGRLHYYEGHPWATVVLPARIAHDLGARIFLVTNAAGGIRDDLVPGSLMALSSHIDWTQTGVGVESNSGPYSPRLNALLEKTSKAGPISLASGIYAQVTGPCYETPSEIRALRSIGADAVGMSTAREIVAAHDLGLECAAISCIANRAAGLSQGPISHEEVLSSMAAMRDRLGELLEGLMRNLD